MTIITYYLTQNRYSRNGKRMQKPQGIVLHHSICEGYSAIAARNYMDNLKFGKNAIYYGTHYIIGPEGEIINCIPENEIAYHRGNSEKSDSFISIEYCTAKSSMPLTPNSKNALIWLVIDISHRYGFDIDTCFLRHYDLCKKKCPQFYSKNEDQWKKLKEEIISEQKAIERLKNNSEALSKKLSKLIGIDKGSLQLMLEQKVSIDARSMSQIFDKLLVVR